MSLTVGSASRMRAIIREELPDPHWIKKITKIYLAFESILCLYLLITLVVAHEESDEKGGSYHNYRVLNALFVFVCIIPFLALRVVTLLCCQSMSMVMWQIFGIWFVNLFLIAVWCMIAMVHLI